MQSVWSAAKSYLDCAHSYFDRKNWKTSIKHHRLIPNKIELTKNGNTE